MPRASRSKKRTSAETAIEEIDPSQQENGGGEEEEEEAGVSMMFSQQLPEMSQPAVPAKEKERSNLEALDPHVRERIVTTLSRLLLFKALAGETIDRTKVFKEAVGEHAPPSKITTAVFEEAKNRLSDVFGFDLVQVPKCMAEHLPKTYQNRYYVISRVSEDGSHSRAVLGVHPSASVEKGLLMLILAFAYCRGEIREGHRWISSEALYRLLNGVDENIPEEPPASSASGKGGKSRSRRSAPACAADDGDGPYGTPDVDSAIDRYVHMDYLLKEKVLPVGATGADAGTLQYAMGPRAALEVGRKQVIYFCAEVMGEQPDPTMMAEIDEGDEDGEEGEEMVEG